MRHKHTFSGTCGTWRTHDRPLEECSSTRRACSAYSLLFILLPFLHNNIGKDSATRATSRENSCGTWRVEEVQTEPATPRQSPPLHDRRRRCGLEVDAVRVSGLRGGGGAPHVPHAPLAGEILACCGVWGCGGVGFRRPGASLNLYPKALVW